VVRLYGKLIFSSTSAGTKIGRKISECGHIRVTMMAGTERWFIEAPAATALVGVDMKNPSPCTDVICLPSKNKNKSMLLRL
jgi:hypothetical protein